MDKAHVINGRSVTFTGTVEGRPLPAAGKLVELQVLLAGEWSTFETTRTGPEGAWSIRYPFKRSCGREVFEFRAHAFRGRRVGLSSRGTGRGGSRST